VKTDYYESSIIRRDGPFEGGLVKAEGALCPDGVRRTAHASGDGNADTFFSIPAFVYAQRKRVYGYITVECVSGSSVPTDDDPATVKFFPYTYRRHHALVEPKPEPKTVPVIVIPPPPSQPLLALAVARQRLAAAHHRDRAYVRTPAELVNWQTQSAFLYRKARSAFSAATGQICP
jgi:hypothetical protein